MMRLIQFVIVLFVSTNVLAQSVPANLVGLGLDGKEKKQKIDANQTYVVSFLSSECPCSQSHVQHLMELQQKNKNIKFIGVLSNAGEELEEAKTQFSNVGFPVYMDEDQSLANAFGAVKTPHVFLFKGNKILFHGGVSDSNNFGKAKERYLEKAIAQVLSGQKVSPDHAKALGCEIRRR